MRPSTTPVLLNALDIEIAEMRRRNAVEVLSILVSEVCNVPSKDDKIAEYTGIIRECDEEILRLRGISTHLG